MKPCTQNRRPFRFPEPMDGPFSHQALIALPELIDREKLEKWLFAKLNPQGALCPECGAELTETAEKRYRSFLRSFCIVCGARIKVTYGTPLQGSHFSLETLYFFSLLLAFDLGNRDLQSLTGIKKSAVGTLQKKFKNFRPPATSTPKENEGE